MTWFDVTPLPLLLLFPPLRVVVQGFQVGGGPGEEVLEVEEEREEGAD